MNDNTDKHKGIENFENKKRNKAVIDKININSKKIDKVLSKEEV
ncbi:hypothetical protein [Staphylococcus gallinarum]